MNLHVRIRRSVLLALALFFVFLPSSSNVFAKDFSGSLSSENVCVYNVEYSSVVFEKNADETIAPVRRQR